MCVYYIGIVENGGKMANCGCVLQFRFIVGLSQFIDRWSTQLLSRSAISSEFSIYRRHSCMQSLQCLRLFTYSDPVCTRRQTPRMLNILQIYIGHFIILVYPHRINCPLGQKQKDTVRVVFMWYYSVKISTNRKSITRAQRIIHAFVIVS